MVTPVTSARTPRGEEDRRHPRNPYLGWYFGLLYLAIAVAVLLALIGTWDRVIGFELGGQRSEGFLLFTPAIAATIGVGTIVRAWRAGRPWREYRARTTPDQRRADRTADLADQQRTPLVFFGGLSLLGGIALGVLARPTSSVGLALLVGFLGIALLVSSACLGLLAQCLRFRAPVT